MAEVVGGLWVTKSEITRSFGIEPGTATGEGVLSEGEGESGLGVGDYVVYGFAGFTFYGLISSIRLVSERDSGDTYRFSILDNRIRARWMMVFGMWNTSEDRRTIHNKILPRPPEGEFATGDLVGDDNADFGAGIAVPPVFPVSSITEASIDRSRVYSHICASQWSAQLKTYTDAPVSAADIIRSAAKAALGGYGFGFDFHVGQSQPVFDIDANSGMTMAALMETIASQQGLQMTIDGARTLRWERRGEGILVIPPPPVHLKDDGLEMSAEATKVRVVGDRNLIQLNNITLEPDWVAGWVAFVNEIVWLDEVAEVWGMPNSTSEQRANIAAKSREITLAQYIAKKGESAYSLADHGTWDSIGRMNMPVWAYLNQIVFRSYRIPEASSIFGLRLRSMEIHDSLLCAVKQNELGGEHIIYRADQVEYYPQANGYVIAQGQPLDLLNFADREEAVRSRAIDMRTAWNEVPEFTIDAPSHSIRFATPIFIDGSPTGSPPTSILLFPNSGQGGYEDVSGSVSGTSDWLQVVVPNPDYAISPAGIKVSLVFRLGKFFKDFGAGQRWKSESIPNICHHLLLLSDGDSFTHSKVEAFVGSLGTPETSPLPILEVLYEDGKNAVQLAVQQSEGFIQRSGIERSGKYLRIGAGGAVVSGVIDRVTTRYDYQQGLTEEVDFSKPRSSNAFVSSKDFARRLMNEELFGGQKDLQREVRLLRGIGKLDATASRNEIKRASNQVITDIFRRSPGTENVSVKTFTDVNSQFPSGRGAGKWRAGDLLWLDDEGLPSRFGTTFGGIVVSSSLANNVVVATKGTVPCALLSGTDPSQSVMANPGEWFASNEGTYPIGLLAHGGAAPGENAKVIGIVKIGHGGGAGVSGRLFCKVYKNPELEPPKSMLLGGQVSGGEGGVVVPDIVLGDIDAPPVDGTHHYLEIEFEAYVGIGELLSGGHVLSVTSASGLTIPANVMPTVASPIGTLNMSLGSWCQGKFIPSGCGNIYVNHCPGSLTPERI